jgi:hypothetical protein
MMMILFHKLPFLARRSPTENKWSSKLNHTVVTSFYIENDAIPDYIMVNEDNNIVPWSILKPVKINLDQYRLVSDGKLNLYFAILKNKTFRGKYFFDKY